MDSNTELKVKEDWKLQVTFKTIYFLIKLMNSINIAANSVSHDSYATQNRLHPNSVL